MKSFETEFKKERRHSLTQVRQLHHQRAKHNIHKLSVTESSSARFPFYLFCLPQIQFLFTFSLGENLRGENALNLCRDTTNTICQYKTQYIQQTIHFVDINTIFTKTNKKPFAKTSSNLKFPTTSPLSVKRRMRRLKRRHSLQLLQSQQRRKMRSRPKRRH